MLAAVPARRAFVVFIACAMALSLVATLSSPVRAATFTVDSTADASDADTTDGVCADSEAIPVCTLRAAIEQANALVGADTINVPAGTFILEFGELVIDEAVAIVGAPFAGGGVPTTIIDGGSEGDETDRVFTIGDDANISNVEITHGNPGSDHGGGIYVESDVMLTLVNSVVSDNVVEDADGGGIYISDGDGGIVITGSTVSGNVTEDGRGGGIYISDFADAVISGSTVSGNSSDSWDGGGIYVDDDAGVVTISGSTISGNTAEQDGGGIYSDDEVTLLNATVSGNTAGRDGGGIYINGTLRSDFATIASNQSDIGGQGGGMWTEGHVELFATIVANNDPGGDCFHNDTGVDLDFNNLDSDGSCHLDHISDKPNTANPMLGTLANNGGPTQTHALLAGSPAIDAVVAVTVEHPCIATDQRGVSRPKDGDSNGAALCDMGAYELALPEISINDVSVTEGNTGTVDVNFTVTLLPASSGTVTVAYATANGTASTPADYQTAAGTVTFVTGDVSETITVKVVGDTVDEPNETFLVNLTAPGGATLADAQGTGTILDDDVAATAAAPTPIPQQVIAAATGTPALGISNTAVSHSGASPIPTIAFGVILLASLATLAYANVRTVRRRC